MKMKIANTKGRAVMKKTDQVRELIENGELTKALRIAKGFRINVTEAQRDAMTRGYECMVNPRFYKSIETDIDEAIAIGLETMRQIVF